MSKKSSLHFRNIFFIGPASVGKTTVGALLAEKIGYKFIDIDQEFCDRIALIPEYAREFGWDGYREANSKLTDDLIREYPIATVFATSSGYLASKEQPHLVEKHVAIISSGTSVLLLPDEDPLRGVDVIVQRQLARWNNITAERERKKFLERFATYKNYGDIKIFSLAPPAIIVEDILRSLGCQRSTIC